VPDSSVLIHEAVELVHALAWPVTTLTIVYWLRVEIRQGVGQISEALTERIRTSRSVTLGPRGFEAKGTADPLRSEVHARVVRLKAFLEQADGGTLDAIANVLGAASAGTTRVKVSAILVEVNKRVKTARDMNELSSRLRPLTQQDF
jgi:hypothetical protein